MTKNKSYTRSKKNIKNNNKRTKRIKGGAEYYAPVGDSDRDSVDAGMESVLARIGISNTPDNKQYGWLTVSVAGIIGIGGIGYLLFKK
jgi:hypothetical protein